MAAGRPIAHGPRSFDDAKLASMTEPLTVRVEKLAQNKRTPIPMWQAPSGGTEGKNWTKDDISTIEGFLVTEWAGGGLYEITVTDSGDPVQIMKWQPWWAPSEYPERTPPPLAETRIEPIQPYNVQVPRMPVPVPGYSPPQYPAPYAVPMPSAPPIGSAQYPAWTAEVRAREMETEAKAARAKFEQLERQTTEERHRQDLERERLAQEARFGKLEQAIAGMSTGISAALKDTLTTLAPKGESAEVVAMKQQLEAMRLQMQAQQESARLAQQEREAERRESALKETMRMQADATQRQIEAMNQQTQRQIEAMNQQFQTLMAQMQNSGNREAPIFTLLQEQQRQHTEALREVVRSGQAQIDSLKGYMMNPRDLLAMARESQQGVDAATDRITKSYSGILEMQQRVTENALNLQPQGGGVVDAIREGVGGLKEFAERYVGAKTTEQKIQAQAQVQLAQAQARVYEAQAYAQAGRPEVVPSQIVPEPMPTRPTQGLNGPAAAPTSEATPPADRAKHVERLWGRTDEQWFGVLLPEVQQLRDGVAKFHVSCEAVAAGAGQDEIEGFRPEQVTQGIIVAAQMVTQRNLAIPAMIELLLPGQFNEFLAALLPDASQAYRDEVVELLKRASDPGEAGATDADDAADEAEQAADEEAEAQEAALLGHQAASDDEEAPEAPIARPAPRRRKHARADA